MTVLASHVPAYMGINGLFSELRVSLLSKVTPKDPTSLGTHQIRVVCFSTFRKNVIEFFYRTTSLLVAAEHVFHCMP